MLAGPRAIEEASAAHEVPPAPGGSSWPIAPTGRGSISGADEIAENALPITTIVTATTPMPARGFASASAAASGTRITAAGTTPRRAGPVA